ncbi:integrase [Burkholderia territorii]|uniref:transposase n=1 Tax=Burkholderia territorii TaxID=1503055 RepID=UPI0007520854|nr:transposase [Burkholderia territorii]KWH08231.1 integrase [Burkholderia territorii]
MNSGLLKGDKLAPPGKPGSYFEVLDGSLHAGHIHIFDAEKGEARFVHESKIRAAISGGTLIRLRKGMPRVNLVAQYDNPLLREHIRSMTNALRRIAAICEQRGISFNKAIPLAREAYEKKQAGQLLPSPFPSRAALYRAHENQQRGLPVLKGDKNKGNDTPRYSEELCEFVKTVINEFFLVTESKWTILKVTDYVNREARRRHLHVAKHAISRKFVAGLIYELTADAEYDRMDPLDRVAGKSYATKRIRAPFPFARIEQDALHLPFVVKTSDGISRDVWLVLAIDVCTGYPVGWHLVIGQPREMDSLRCLEMYLTPAKEARFKELGITHSLNIYGTAVQIIFDNGSEVKGTRIVRLEVLQVDVKHCKAKEAQGKPFIERLNKSLKVALELLEGCTRFNGKDGERDPVALGDKLMTVEELERWIVRWLYEVWVNSPLDRLRWDELLIDSVKGKTPLDRMKWMTEEAGYPIPMPPPRHEWMAALYERTSCVLSAKTGISVEGYRYKGDKAISYLLGKYGDRAELRVVYNPDDFREVYVHESDELPLVTLTHEHVRPDTPAWTFKEAKERFKTSKDGESIPQEKAQFQDDLDAEATKNKPARKTRSKRAESQETTRRTKVQAAAQRAVDNPLSSGTPFGPAPSTNPSLPMEDIYADAISYDDAPLMNIVNRNTGERLL